MGLRNWAKRKTMGAIIGMILKRAAEGNFGPLAQRAYWALAGSKTLIAVILAFVAGVVKLGLSTGLCGQLGIAVECTAVDASVGNAALYISGALAFLGQVDGGLRLAPPQK